ncbi:MAG: hypothetical protein HOE80_03295 [Candidatus Magasanikbacteria bacterium]|jgi:ferredoxin-NADP reductase|nr:hypothetical protein [Candidatus Magasanikbacteria bacterium]MBT4071722.1 hypothetical protein [Candidatus Magasanikbacteria bacterium]
MNTFTTTLLKKTNLCEDVFEFHFSKPKEFTFIAGQFIQTMIPHEGAIVPRSYSIASNPTNTHLIFSIKIIPNGIATTYLHKMNIGDKLEIRGPIGHYISKEKKPITCIATGVGIAPNMSLIYDELTTKNNPLPIRLLFGVREEKDLFWVEKLEELANNYTNFSYTITLSQAHDSWGGIKGRVTKHIPENIAADEQIYICGNPHMVADVRNAFLKNNVDKTQIHIEVF